MEVGRAGPSQTLSSVLERQHIVIFTQNKCDFDTVQPKSQDQHRVQEKAVAQ